MSNDSRELLVRYQGGDASAADAIFARYTSRLLALARSRLSPKLARRIDADDVVQSTYRSFFAHAREGDFTAEREGDLWRLLAAITLHKLGRQAERHRAAKRAMGRETPQPADSADLSAWSAVDREPSPADVVAAVEELHWLLSQFEPIARQAIELRLQEMTLDEIAAKIGRSERTVRRWLVEARELLAERWKRQQSHGHHSLAAHSPLSESVVTSVAAPLRHNDYRLERLIGSGGMSKVYLATELATGRPVAVKILRKRLRSRPRLVERFLREAELVSRFSHPSILPIQGIGRLPDGTFFLVMDFVDGEDLAKVCRAAPLSPGRAAEIVATVAEAIQHAHEHGVIHRDLKPGNVLLDRAGRVFVTDFGFAWFDSELDRDDRSILGTVGFMAPEQIDRRLGPIGPHTDLFGLGALLHMLSCGEPPLTVDSLCHADSDSISAHASRSAKSRALPAPLRAICVHCLAKDWRARFASAAEFAAALRTLLSRVEDQT